MRKAGKVHDLPAHHKAEEYVDAHLALAGAIPDKITPLFRRIDRKGRLQDKRLDRREVLAMIKRRARLTGLPDSLCCHSFRATGITTYMQNGDTLERALQIANEALRPHERRGEPG